MIASAALLFIVVPTALTAAANRLPGSSSATVATEAGPIPADASLHLAATVKNGHVHLSWPATRVAAGGIAYWIVRGSDCSGTTSLSQCNATTTIIAGDNRELVDTPPPGRYVYVLELSANWLDDPTAGDPQVASPPVTANVP